MGPGARRRRSARPRHLHPDEEVAEHPVEDPDRIGAQRDDELVRVAGPRTAKQPSSNVASGDRRVVGPYCPLPSARQRRRLLEAVTDERPQARPLDRLWLGVREAAIGERCQGKEDLLLVGAAPLHCCRPPVRLRATGTRVGEPHALPPARGAYPSPARREATVLAMPAAHLAACSGVTVHGPDIGVVQLDRPACLPRQRGRLRFADRGTGLARRPHRGVGGDRPHAAGDDRALEQRVRELEAQLAKFSRNSSRPPSSDPPGAPPPAPPKRTGRKRGGQPGHDKQSRSLVPPEQVTRTEVLKPDACRRCGGALEGDDPDPYRHQVIDVPKVAATVEEYQLHALDCPRCCISTRATLPPGVPSGNFGPRLQAIVAVCSGAYRMSKRGIEELVEDFFGVPISLGSVANLEQATSKAVEVPVEEVARAIREEPIVHADETGWFEGSKRAWLWAAITAHLALFLVRTSRGAKVAKELLGAAFAGILVSDRWSAYSLGGRGASAALLGASASPVPRLSGPRSRGERDRSSRWNCSPRRCSTRGTVCATAR